MDFRTIADTAFDDLLILRDATTARRQSCEKEIQQARQRLEYNSDTLPELQDLLVRNDALTRAEATARTQDLGCHLLHVLAGVGS
jgi:hypothetical protein